ncbi:6-phosphogluconate dehydrogenase C-terminal domain-like protein [Abortiporus biennis]|nr:6-phosphogluconate dehydrogenase C-terminal domain-like protein [Abortiporus biennis]
MSKVKDVLFVGFGAVGAIFAYTLKKGSNARVTIVARSNYEAIKASNGMYYKSQKYGEHKWMPDRLCSSIAEAADRAYSHIVVTSKAVPELQKTPQLLEPFFKPSYTGIHPQPTYILMQNGLNIEVDLYKAVKALNPEQEPRIISTALWIGTRLTAPNTVDHNDFDRISMGIYRPTPNITTNTPEETAVLKEFGDMFNGGGTEISIVPEIQRVKFMKNVWNSVFGPVATLSRYTLTSVFRPPQGEATTATIATIENKTPSQIAVSGLPYSYPSIHDYTLPFIYDVLDEVVKLGNVRFPPDEDGKPVIDPDYARQTLENTSRVFAKPTSTERPSILVDCENGRPMEVEVLVGELVRMGRDLGVPMPRMESFYALLLIIQMQLLYGSR